MTDASAGPAFVDERQAVIREYVSTRGRARIAELAALLGVTEVTIRKDLRVLHERGVLRRTHGGAIALTPLVERELAGRAIHNREAKEAIGRRCAAMIRDGDSVFLDSGTTVDAIARALFGAAEPTPRNITVLTNTLGVAEAAAAVPGVDHVLLGGELRSSSRALVGPMVLRGLQQFTVTIAFIGASGLSEAGISVSSLAEAEIKATVVENARRVVVAADRSKLGATDFARICQLDEIDTLVMDESVPGIEELCAAHEIELVIAASAQAAVGDRAREEAAEA